jgi:hypothetical protein
MNKKTMKLMSLIIFLCALFFPCWTQAAGSWSTATLDRGNIDNALNPVIGIVTEFTADASTGSIPIGNLLGIAGLLVDVGIVYDETTPPDAVTIAITDKYGATLVPATAKASPGGRLGTSVITSLIPFADGLKITITNNTTHSAKAKIILYVI